MMKLRAVLPLRTPFSLCFHFMRCLQEKDKNVSNVTGKLAEWTNASGTHPGPVGSIYRLAKSSIIAHAVFSAYNGSTRSLKKY